jgi:outer membrane receptor protein involved in Fe transport
MGFFGQDSWRVRPNLTINGGVRWEVQFPFTSQNTVYAANTFDGLFGVSVRETFSSLGR